MRVASKALLLALLALLARPAEAVPAAVPYVGFLTDDSGLPFAGAVEVGVALYEAPDGGDPVWGPHSFGDVSVSEGVLEFLLGGPESAPLDSGLLASGRLWLEVTLDGAVLAPRQELLSVPYALLAGDAEYLGGEPAASFVTDAELPDFGDFLTASELQPVCLSGSYDDLLDRPDLTVFLRADEPLELGGDLDLAGHSIVNLAIDSQEDPPASPVPGQLWWNAAESEIAVWTGTEWVSLGGNSPAPRDLSAVSNGTLTNRIDVTRSSTAVPVPIPDNRLSGAEATIHVLDSGALRSVSVSVRITHPDAAELVVSLAGPGGEMLVLHDQGPGDEGGLDRSWPPTAVLSGDLDAFVDADPAGTWSLLVADRVDSGGEAGATVGAIESFTLSYELDSTSRVVATGGLTVDGIDVGQSLSRDRIDIDRAFKIGGSGREGVLNVSSGSTQIAPGLHNFESIHIAADATLTVTEASSTPLYLRSLGDCVIEGTIDLAGMGAAGGESVAGCGTREGHAGEEGLTSFDTEPLAGEGAANTIAGGALSAADGNEKKLSPTYVILSRRIPFAVGSGGGSGRSQRTGTSGRGGNGGAGLVLECAGRLVFTGTIDVRGEDGGDGTGWAGACSYTATCAGGGGGGAGGGVVMLTSRVDLDTGEILTAGGAGGGYVCDSDLTGEPGGDGFSILVEAPDMF